MIVTEEEFKDWRQHPITLAFMKALFNDREYLKEMILAGTDDDANLRGRAVAIRSIIEMSYEDITQSLTGNK